MTEVSVGLRYNEESEEVEVYASSEGETEVIGTSGQDYFKSWVETYNEKHPEVKVVIEEVKPAEPVVTPVPEVTPVVEPVVEPTVDKTD